MGLSVVSQFPGDPVWATSLPITSVNLNLSNPACIKVLPESGACSIQFNSLSASGSDTSFSRVEILANGHLRVYMVGFFESSAFINSRMLPGGLAVACGKPNDGGLPNYGKSYSITTNAYMADGAFASNSAVVFCPAYDGEIYLPLIKK